GANSDVSIERHIHQNRLLAEASLFDPNDGALSGGEKALSTITDALTSQADRLDAAELRSIAQVVTQYAQEVQDRESAAWAILNRQCGKKLDDGIGEEDPCRV